jgi:hypothetical protein
MNGAAPSPAGGVKDSATSGRREGTGGDAAVESVFYALFRIVEVAEYSGPEQAIEWAQSVLGDPQLLHAFVERVRELPAGDRRRVDPGRAAA